MGGSRYGVGVVAAICGGLGLRTRMRLFSCGLGASSSSSPSPPCDEAMGRLRLPLDGSRSSVLANQDKGAVTMFFMVPSKEESERTRGFGLRRRWLSGGLDDGGIGKQNVSRVVTS